MSAAVHESLDEQIARIVASLLLKMLWTEDGATRCAEQLRKQGWTCTPPAAKPAKRRKGGKG